MTFEMINTGSQSSRSTLVGKMTERVMVGGHITGDEFVEILDEIDKDRVGKLQIVSLLTAFQVRREKEKRYQQ